MKKIIAILMCSILAAVMVSSMAFADDVQETEAAKAAEVVEDAEAAEEDELVTEADDASALITSDLRTVEPVLSEDGEIVVGDYSVIEIPADEVEVTEEEVNSYIDSMLSYSTSTETITEGTVENGDTANIDFSGVLAGEEEPFEGGTAQGYDLILGSGMFIPGFEDQVIGHEIGETFDINVTFPEEYTESLAGKDVVFTVTINSKSISVTPELDDDFVKSFSAENLDEELETVEDLQQYTYDYLYNSKLTSAITTRIQQLAEPVSYNESQFALLKDYFMEELNYNAQMYAAYGMEGYDADSIAQMSGFADADSYAADEAVYYLDIIMLLDKIAEDKGIEYTDEEVDALVQNFIDYNGYGDIYTVEEFKEM